MKKIGMVVAVELDAVLKKYGERLKTVPAKGFDVRSLSLDGYELVIVNSGAGEIAAAAATQYLIDVHGAELIVNFGVVGGLTEEMTVARLAVVTGVVHYDFDISDFMGYEKGRYSSYPTPLIPTTERLYKAALAAEPSLKPVVCASGDKFIGGAEKKRALNKEFGADICEMEAAGIVLTCNRSGVPCLLVKAVSDAMHGGAAEFESEVDRCAELCFETLDRVLKGL